MEKILKFFEPLFKKNYSHPYSVLSISIILAIISGYFALHLKIDTNIANLLPSSFESVKALNKLEKMYGGEESLLIGIKSNSFKDNKRFAKAFIPKALKLWDPRTKQYFFHRAVYKRNTEVLKDNALYLATNGELGEITSYLKNEIRKAKEKANPFYFSIGGNESQTDSTRNSKISKFDAAYNSLIPGKYMTNADSTVMVIKLYPTGSKSDIRFLKDMFAKTNQLIKQMNPKSYNSQMVVMAGGGLLQHLLELDSIMKDVISSFASGISSVLLLVMLYFFFKKYLSYRKGAEEDQKHNLWSHIWRAPVPLLIIGIPLVISLSFTFGIAYFTIGKLNTMTSVLFVILFGMGIDYGIHFYARYLEVRSSGKNVYDALIYTYESGGAAIMTSAFTTAISMYILMIADFKGFSQFGLISGNGILLSLLCMMFILPSIIVLLERYGLILVNTNVKDSHLKKKPHRFPFARTIVLVGIIVSVFVILDSHKLYFQYNFSKLEPKYPKREKFDNLINGVFKSDLRNPAFILANTDKQVIQILKTLRERMKRDSTIADVEAIQERFPMNAKQQQEKLKKIAGIRQLLNDPFIKGQKGKELNRLRQAAQTTKPLPLSKIPNYIKDRFMTKNGKIGRFVIVYPSLGLSDGKNSIAFKNDVGKVTTPDGKTFYAASTSIVAANMLQLMLKESPYMVVATFILVLIFMFLAFRSVRWTIIAMSPLIIGMIWTFGIMILLGMSFNFYNLVVLPAILGIGEDSGVHLAARYREEGKNSMWDVLSSTGQHISMGSITTVFGFSGLLFTDHPGLISIGALASIGIGMTLITALVFLPALVQWLEDKDWIVF